MARRLPKERVSVSFLGLRAEAEGVIGIAALVAVIILFLSSKWMGLS